MSTNLLLALILLPLMGALIAWAGDLIGYRLGRSRRSLFGLRPRTTATLVGAAFGATLPLVGLGFAMIISPDARDALLRIDLLRQEARDLGDQNKTLLGDILQARADAQSARQRVNEAHETLSRAESNLSETQSQLLANRGALGTTQRTLQAAERSLKQAREGLQKAQFALKQQNADLSFARKNVRDVRGALSLANTQLVTAKTEFAQAQSELGDAQKRLMSVQAEIEPLKNVQRQFNEAKQEYDLLQTHLAAVEQQLARYRLAHKAIVTQDVAFEPGQEILRAYVDSTLSQDQIEAMLNLFVDRAGRLADEGYGIARGPNGRAVRVISPVPIGLMPGQATESEVISEVASQIHGGQLGTYVVLLRAWGRAFRQQAEEMAVEFWAAPNKIVFKSGEVILQGTVDGSQPRALVFGELWAIVKDIRRVAIDRGMLQNPRTGQYGEVPADDLLNALDKILAIKKPARIKAIAQRDVRVAPPESAPMIVSLEVSAVENN